MTTEKKTTLEEAVETRDRWERDIRVIMAIEERNLWADNEWTELHERLIEEYIGEPLSITWHGHTDYHPDHTDDGWEIDYVDVLYGTGGPATGITFRDFTSADVWFQNWFTTRETAVLDPDCAAWLAGHLGLEFS